MTLKEATERLSESGIDDPRKEARSIFSLIGKIKDYELFSPNTECDIPAVKEAIERRANREPLQYILGRAHFYRETYKVTSDTLIPREDTEMLVDYAVKHLPKGASFLDLCTGGGCIALSVLNNTEDTRAVAVDISVGAINTAKENAKMLGLCERVEFLVFDAMKKIECGELFAVLSNPPYVTNKAYESLEKEIYFEPKSAFVGGEDGGDFYRAITPLYRDAVDPCGFIAYEIGYDQRALILKIAEDNKMDAEIIRDLSGNDRVAILRRKSN